ncbi:MAG: twin-arginine translocase TatA/TatE family subunit [Candidatus Acidiferrum sp.]
MLSIPHMVVLFIIVLVVFGPNKLPELARGFGKLMAEFRKASTDFKSAFEQEMREMERQNVLAERKKAAEAAAAASAAAAAAAPTQPATLATAPGTEAAPAGGALEPADTRATEALVAIPATEAIARGAEGIEDFSNNSGGSASTNGAGHATESENTIANPHQSAAPSLGPAAAPTTASDPAHDTQQPA